MKNLMSCTNFFSLEKNIVFTRDTSIEIIPTNQIIMVVRHVCANHRVISWLKKMLCIAIVVTAVISYTDMDCSETEQRC